MLSPYEPQTNYIMEKTHFSCNLAQEDLKYKEIQQPYSISQARDVISLSFEI